MSKKAFTTAEEILALISLAKVVEVEVPEVDKVFLMRVISDRERDDFELHLLGKDGQPDMSKMRGYRTRLLAQVLVNEAGERLFANGKADGLANLPSSITVPLYEHAERLNQLGDYSKTVDKELESELKKA